MPASLNFFILLKLRSWIQVYTARARATANHPRSSVHVSSGANPAFVSTLPPSPRPILVAVLRVDALARFEIHAQIDSGQPTSCFFALTRCISMRDSAAFHTAR